MLITGEKSMSDKYNTLCLKLAKPPLNAIPDVSYQTLPCQMFLSGSLFQKGYRYP